MQLFVSHSEGAARLEQEAGQDVIQGEYVLLALQERAGKRENAHPFSKINSMKLVFLRLRNEEKCSISINCTYLTTAELLPPGSQRDSFVLTGGGVRLITGTAQLLAATLSTQVKQAVPEVGADVLVL